jgi:gas vesicle protein
MSNAICNSRALNYLAFFVAGAGMGAAVALLFAPRTGRDTRKMLARRAEDGMDFVAETGKDLLRHAEDAVERGKGWAGKLAQ